MTARWLAPSRTRLVLVIALAAAMVLGGAGVALAQNPVPVQTYYVSLPETDALEVLSTINSAAVNPTYSYFSIVIALNNTYVYYDQWEDGYAADVANPTSGEIYSASNLDGVQIWGNGTAADGCAPNKNGADLTCTDGNDVLNAGDMIIPYNVVPLVTTQNVLDSFSAVAYNNNNGNTNWSGDWVETGDPSTGNYRDEFASQQYNLSVGSIPWTTSWTEINDDGLPTNGDITVNLGATYGLEIGDTTAVGVAIYRVANLAGYTAATLSYSYEDSANQNGDAVQVQVRNPPGAWVTLATINGNSGTGTGSHDITAYIDSDTEVRFYVSAALESGDEIYFDNVNIALTGGPGIPGAGDILITGGQLRFSETEANDSLGRGVSLPTGEGCATLSFTLGQSGIDPAGDDNLAVQISADGATYTTLATYTSAADAGVKTIGIPQSATAAGTRVRFISLGALEAGEYWSVDDVQIAWGCSRNPAQIFYDARDKIAASHPIAMSRAVWGSGSGTLNAYAHEMYPTSEWGLAYEAPVGQNTAAPGTSMFEYSGLTIMASQADTAVQIDANADGVYEQSVLLQEGGTYLVNGTLQGARVQADKPVQVALLTGDINDSYESRDMNLLPTSAYGNSYWSPVGVMWNANPTRLWLYNPSSNGSIYITCERYGVANVTLGPVAPRGVVTLDLGAGQGARCFASLANGTPTTDKIFAIGTVDTAAGDGGGDDGSRSDWSFALYPDTFLSTDALIGLGLGRDPTSGVNPTENGSPLWVTAACGSGSTYVYVDWNNDGTADPVDTDGDGTAEAGTENGILANRLQSVRLYQPSPRDDPYDQSGARVWSRTASGVGYGGTPGCKLALAWGQDPNRATAAAPGLDVGTSVPPLRLAEATKSIALKVDADHDGRLSRGDTATYNMMIRNSGAALVANVHIYDTIPSGTTYVNNSTEKDLGSGWVSIPDDTPPASPHPLDVTGGVLLGDLDVGETFYVRFDVTLDITLNPDASVFNCEASLTDSGRYDRCVLVPTAAQDWGDLPDSYKTVLASNGPRHLVYADTNGDGLPNAQGGDEAVWLGPSTDRDLNGQPSADAKGDDNDKRPATLDTNDEDGVALVNPRSWVEGAGGGTIDVTLSGTGAGQKSAWLVIWFDWNRDGDFADAGEAAINQLVTWTTSGTVQRITFAIPAGISALDSDLYYRARLFDQTSSPGAGAYIGAYTNGEVEDYIWFKPTLVFISDFSAYKSANHVVVQWSTAAEIGTVGFHLLRLDPSTRQYVQVNEELLPSVNASQGGEYRFVDDGAEARGDYTYQLVEIESSGKSLTYGPFKVRVKGEGQAVPGGYQAVAHEVSARKAARAEASKAAKNKAKQDKAKRNGAALKIAVNESGLYYLDAAKIASLIKLNINQVKTLLKQGNLELQTQGQKVPYVTAADNTGLYFYGQRIESLYTDENVYWLQQGSALRMSEVKGRGPSPASAVGTFAETIHVEQDLRGLPTMFKDPQADYWFWDYVITFAGYDRKTFTVSTPGAVPGPATLTVHVFGGSDTPAQPEHHVVISLNGQQIGEGRWDGVNPFDLTIASDALPLSDGDNILEVQAVLDSGVPYSMFFVDSVDVSYTRSCRAVNNTLLLRAPGSQVFTVEGFREQTIWVFDVSDPANPKQVLATTVNRASDGGYRVSFASSAAGGLYLALTPGAARAPLSMAADAASDLRNTGNGADYIIVAPTQLKEAAQVLANYRQSKGLSARVVDLEDIYDEFNYGIASPEAIRAFLSYAYQRWAKAPSYVLLAGEGSYDYKDNLGFGDNLIPVWMASTPGGLYAADNCFADVVGADGVPEMAIGRLPVVTAQELTALIAKIVSYERGGSAGWANQVIMLADNADDAGDFAATSDGIAALLGDGYTADKIYLGQQSIDSARSALLAQLNAGAGLLNYVGHAGLDKFADEGLLTTDDVSALSNGAKLPVAALMTCAAGQYAMPGYDAIGEALLLRDGGGAVAVWAPTGLSENSAAAALDEAFFRALFQRRVMPLGKAVQAALQEYSLRGTYPATLAIYNLLGDPALEVK